ncbi:MAG: PKD domain-containing protein [Bacteroidetes bacterium]|nr:PKD domain-containing protein [Bacteroidota bacterium]
MKSKLYLFFLFLLFSNSLFAQSNWSALLPAQFPTNVSGQIHGISRISQMKFHPTNPNKFYAVSARGGLFISNNGGTTWTIAPGTDAMPVMRLASVCIDFSNDQIIYLGTGDHNYYYSGSGVWKSTDGGNTFAPLGLSGKLVIDMIMDPANANTIVAITNTGIYKTTNAGSTWTLKTASRAFDDLKAKANSTTRTLFAATTDSAFFRSTDFGDTWTQINAGIVLPSGVTNGNGVRLGVTPADSNVVYLSMVANGGMVYKSVDGGTTFTGMKTTSSPFISYYSNSSASSGQGDYNHGFGVDRTDPNTIWYVAHCVYKSTDGGLTWIQQTIWSQVLHTDMHQMVQNPYNSSQLYNMNDGGVWLSTDGGANWVPKSDGIYGYEIYHGNCSPTQRETVSIGTQDNGELYSTGTGWFTNRGGDWSSKCSFDYRPSSTMVYYHSKNQRALVTGNDVTYGLPSNVTLLQDITFHRSNTNLAFVADTVILRTTNLLATTPTWTQIANLGKKIMAMHCSFADPNRLYIITADAMIYVSTNALSATPTFTSYALPNNTNNAASITSIRNSPNTIYITCNTRVYRSTDNGATWTNITLNLPSTNHVRILADEYFSSNELVFLATSNTVYFKNSSNSSWTIFNTNLPTRTEVVDLSIYNDSTPNSILRVATYGRGIFETSISSVRTLTANFSANNLYPCLGGSVQFGDLSTGSPTSWAWTFPGGTPGTSTLANPLITYSSAGTYNVTLTVSNGVSTNTFTRTAYISTKGGNIPLAENFEGAIYPPSSWTEFDDAADGVKWQVSTAVSGFGNEIQSIYFNNWTQNATGKKDEIRTPRLNGESYNSITLKFDVAYWSYTNQTEQDTLQVLISTDCGNTFTQVYNKGGATLSTVPGNSTSAFTPTSTQWRTETINLNAYIGQSFILAFRNVARYGNNLYLDNINVNATVAAIAGPDVTICSGGSTTIGGASTAGINYSWRPAATLVTSLISNPVATPVSTQQYILTATHALSGIFARDTMVVTVIPNSATILVPLNSSMCRNIPFNIPFTVACNYNPGNIFTAELSDSSGSFANVVPIGSLTSISNGTISALIPSNVVNGSGFRIRIVSSSPVTTGANNGSNISISDCAFSFNLKVFIQGYYVGSSTMRATVNPVLYPTLCDTLTMELHNTVSPYALSYLSKGTINVTGNGSFLFPTAAIGQQYYVVINHRNALQTWSANPVSVTSGGSYDFTTAAGNAFGSNQIQVSPGVFAIYSGDISNGISGGVADGQVTMADLNELQAFVTQFLNNYNYHDLNGDFSVESLDYSLMENNLNLNLVVKKP